MTNSPQEYNGYDLSALDLTPELCPNCESTNGKGEVIGMHSDSIHVWVTCLDSGNAWVEVSSIVMELRFNGQDNA